TGTNDPLSLGNGPATYNDYDWFDSDPGQNKGYSWTTYPERLEEAGISWQIYQDVADNFTNNPLAGFQSFRNAWFRVPGYSQALRDRGLTTRTLEKLADDVKNNRLPQVSWIIADAAGSEHPDPSSPAQGADYVARVLNALTANPEVWSRTVLLINFDENDGFFDHMPPPAPPSYTKWNADPARATRAGDSTVDTKGEYHENLVAYRSDDKQKATLHRPYGLGPRVPLYVISPWSKGGWVNSQVFDHTSIIRFVEARFGVYEPNISAWRRAVCGDLTSAFDFSSSATTKVSLPSTLLRAERAKALTDHSLPIPPSSLKLPVQANVVRPSRALPYQLNV
ncbi:MAG: phospholipase C, phosphocholine-specific, partial [Proteobacteria bacterium]